MPDARPKAPAETAKPQSTPQAMPLAQADWRDTLPEDWTAPSRDLAGKEVQVPLRRHPALAKYASKDEAIKALVHAQRLLGKKAEPGSLLSQGGGTDCPEGPGCPQSPADYRLPQIDLPEDFSVDDTLRAAFLEKAHQLALTDDQVGGLYAWFMSLNVQALLDRREEEQADRALARERELAALRKVHGGAAQAVLEAARRAVLALGGNELMERLEACGAANDARIVQAFSRVAPMVSESALGGRGVSPAQGLTPQRLREMMRDPRYYDPSRRDADFVRQVREGFENLYPGEKEQGLRM